jgi:hypothetical protein
VYAVDHFWSSLEEGHPVDTAYMGVDEEYSYAQLHGTGCYNTWNNQLAQLGAESVGSRTRQSVRLTYWAVGLRPNSLTNILFGSSGVGRQYPFLCNFLYVSDVWSASLRLADNQGGLLRTTVEIPYQPSLVDHQVHMQGYCIDDGRHPLLLPVTLTNGLQVGLANVPPPPTPCCGVNGSLGSTRGGTAASAPIVELR